MPVKIQDFMRDDLAYMVSEYETYRADHDRAEQYNQMLFLFGPDSKTTGLMACAFEARSRLQLTRGHLAKLSADLESHSIAAMQSRTPIVQIQGDCDRQIFWLHAYAFGRLFGMDLRAEAECRLSRVLAIGFH